MRKHWRSDMLWLEIINDGTGTPEVGHYHYEVGINHKTLKEGRIENFDRSEGYEALLKLVVKNVNNE
jgi:hypothetical protein